MSCIHQTISARLRLVFNFDGLNTRWSAPRCVHVLNVTNFSLKLVERDRKHGAIEWQDMKQKPLCAWLLSNRQCGNYIVYCLNH